MALLLFGPLSAFAVSAAPGGSRGVDETLARARALIGAERSAEALALLRALPLGGGRRLEVLFETGRAAVEAAMREDLSDEATAALLDEATGALDAVLAVRPDHADARFQLGRARFLKGEDASARRQFGLALAARPPLDVAVEIDRYIAFMKKARRWSGYLGAGLAFSDNIGGASDREIIWIDVDALRIPVPLDEEDGPQRGAGLALWGGAEYAHPLTARLSLRAGADAVRRDHAGRRFDRDWLGVHAGPRWRPDEETEVSLLAEAARVWDSGRPDSDTVGVRVEAAYSPDPRLGLYANAGWRWRDVRRDDAQDGPEGELSLTAVWAATEAVSLHATLARQTERPRVRAWRNATVRGRLGVAADMPLGFTADISGEWGRTAYEGGSRAGPGRIIPKTAGAGRTGRGPCASRSAAAASRPAASSPGWC